MTDLLLRDVEVEGQGRLDVAIADGLITNIAPRLAAQATKEIDAQGGALIPGLWDHHIHLLATAAALTSVPVGPETVSFDAALRQADSRLPPGVWLRATGYHDSVAGPLDRHRLDQLLPDRPTRIQYGTGSLWALNTAGVARLGGPPYAPGVELGPDGAPTGRIFREDAWLRDRIGAELPFLAEVAARLDRSGVVGLTDASVTTTDAGAAALVEAAAKAGLRQHLLLMSGGPLTPAPRFAVGAVKILLDDHDLGDFDGVVETMRTAHASGRTVAVHCVTAGELAFALAAWGEAGVRAGDRIEHGGVIDPDAAAQIAALGLTVVTQPGFIADRGDRYRADVDSADLPHLYPCASLLARGIAVAGSSDAPYGPLDPWAGMRAAVSRRSREGHVLGAGERVTPRAALGLWLGDPASPGVERRVAVGGRADLCLMRAPLDAVLDTFSADLVVATIIGGCAA